MARDALPSCRELDRDMAASVKETNTVVIGASAAGLATAACLSRAGVSHVVLESGRETLPGLYLCGFYVSPMGMLREIAIEAKRIAALIAPKAR